MACLLTTESTILSTMVLRPSTERYLRTDVGTVLLTVRNSVDTWWRCRRWSWNQANSHGTYHHNHHHGHHQT